MLPSVYPSWCSRRPRPGVVAAVDESGALASVAVLVVQPSGAGGSIVTVPVSADATNGKGDERLPIAETVALSGPDVARSRSWSRMLGLGIDAFEVVDADRLAALLRRVGPIEVELPADVTDAEARSSPRPGGQTLDAGRGGGDPHRPRSVRGGHRAVPGRDGGVVGGRRGDRATGSRRGSVADRPAPDGRPSTTCWRRSPPGPVGARGLRADPLDAEHNPRGVDVSLLDQAEITLVFAQIAPGKVAAPNPALTLRSRRRSPTSSSRAPASTNNEVAYAAISSLLFVGGNVLSVDTAPGTCRRADDGRGRRRDAGRRHVTASTCCSATSTCRSPTTRIVGVDAVVRLGTDYLELLAVGRRRRSADG